MFEALDANLLMSAGSLAVTAYFWLVKARRERPNLQFHQISNFRTALRRNSSGLGGKRLMVQQLDTGGVLVANHSTRQNSIILFECKMRTPGGTIAGEWGYGGDDKPPWNIGPESTIAFSPACIFPVPDDFEEPDDVTFELDFITASGQRFRHTFSKHAPNYIQIENQATAKAA